jgi:hypothetical protein
VLRHPDAAMPSGDFTMVIFENSRFLRGLGEAFGYLAVGFLLIYIVIDTAGVTSFEHGTALKWAFGGIMTVSLLMPRNPAQKGRPWTVLSSCIFLFTAFAWMSVAAYFGFRDVFQASTASAIIAAVPPAMAAIALVAVSIRDLRRLSTQQRS